MAASGPGEDDGTITGINVTPLVDITLVLLIIFMVTAKLIDSQGLPLDLPKAASGQDVQLQFAVELHPNGDVLVDGKKVQGEEGVLPLAKEAHSRSPDLRAVIRADATVPHGRVMRALDLLKQAGLNKVAFGITSIPPETGAVKPAPGGAPAPAPSP